MYLLDTNVVLELRRPDRADAHVRMWARDTAAAGLFLSTITILEIEIGILRVERRDPAQAAALRIWLEEGILVYFSDRILAVDLPVARRCAALHVPDPRSERDAMIAATALVHGMAIVTRNTADFRATGVRLLDPWGQPAR